MKRFQTPLERIRRIAKQRVDMQRLRLGKINSEIQTLNVKTQEIESEISSTEGKMTRSLGMRTGSGQLMAHYYEIDRLKTTQQELNTSIQELNILEDQEFLALAELQAHEQALEKLVTKRRNQHRKEQLKFAQVEIDEIAIRKQSHSSERRDKDTS